MTKNNELQFESNEVKVYVQQLQAENSILRQSNDEKNELLIKLGCPTTAAARRKVFTLEQQLEHKERECEELKQQVDDLLHKPKIQDKILWKIDNEQVLLGQETYIYKLKQTLTELKEIAESEMDSKEVMAVQYMLNGSVDNKNKVLKQILQKINEVIDE